MEFHFKDRHEWHDWLMENSGESAGIWMIIYKKHTGIPTIGYDDAVEEALCFGWIDGKIRKINDEYYIRYYTPRRSGSRWSKYNIDRVEKLKREGKMTPAGMDAYSEIFRKPYLVYDNSKSEPPEIPDDFLSGLKASSEAYENFMNFPPSARRIYIEWYLYAKQDKTRIARLEKIIRFSEQNRRPGMQ